MGYAQFCGLARALDTVGDRWTLLIVRELLAGPRRYTQLRAGLPGVATNLLADRLRRLEGDGLVARDGGDYRLTPRGASLRGAIDELIRWSVPLMVSGRGDDHFRPHWLVPALHALLVPAADGRLNVTVEGHVIHVVAAGGDVIVGDGPTPAPDTELTIDGPALLAVAAGARRLDDVVGDGATLDGRHEVAAALLEGRTVAATTADTGRAVRRRRG